MTQFLQRTALIALATSALGACSTLEPMGPAPTTTAPPAVTPPSVPQTPPSPPVDAPIAAAPAAPVEQRPLEALPPARSAPPPPPALSAPPPRPPAPVVSAPPPPTWRTVTTRTVTGRVVEVEGPAKTYRVRKGDTPTEVADRLGVSLAELRRLNGLRRHKTIHPGDVLKGSTTHAKAYVAERGDTLFSVARRFSVSADELRDENGLGSDSLRVGQKLRLPEGYRDRGPQMTTSRVRVDADAAEPAAPSRSVVREPDVEPDAVERPAGSSFRTVTTRSVTGRVIEVQGPAVTHRVRKGENLTEVADKLGVSLDELRELNGLKRRRSTIHPGQVLKGPRRSQKAYVAGQGDTLSSIGKRFGVTAEELRLENGLSRRAAVRSGQKLLLPSGYRDRGPVTSTLRVPVAPVPQAPPPVAPRPRPLDAAPPPVVVPPVAAPAPPLVPATPQPYSRPLPPPPRSQPRVYTPAPASGPVAAPTSAPTPADEQLSALGRGKFIWPIQGSIISDFGPKGTGQRNDGINIAADVGQSVRAAAPGDVVYAGDQVPGFGNLVLIKHADGWVSAYGHLSRVLVKMQQKVSQGQEIGFAGATGGVSEPQLHFEIRYAPSPLERAKPIDPKLVLPR